MLGGGEGTQRLSGVRVLVTRPAAAAARLADAFAAEGAVVHRVPALAIVPVEDRRSAERLSHRLTEACAAVFTSVNAVEGFFGAASGAAPDRLPATVLAVGPATAAALRARGVADVRTPDGRFDSEGVLACPQLAAPRVNGRLVALIKGEGGRDLLGRALAGRGAGVREVNVYRRRAPAGLAERLEAVRESVDIVTVTSAEALENLMGAAPWTASWLSNRTLVTVSERVAGIARTYCLSRVAVAAGADAASVVDAAVRSVVNPGEADPGEADSGQAHPDSGPGPRRCGGDAGSISASDGPTPARCKP